MKRIAEFQKVSEERYLSDFPEELGDRVSAETAYATIKLPVRSTAGSAGYDFVTPVAITLAPGESVKVPTGIRAKMEPGWVLSIFPRSGLGFKYRVRLDNTVGIIDSDYYYSDNEGQIFTKITNEGNKTLVLNAGDKFTQGIFTEYGITYDDSATAIRNGGFGSTDKIKPKK